MCKQLAGIPEHWAFFFFFSFPPSMKIEAANFCSEWLAGVCVCVFVYILELHPQSLTCSFTAWLPINTHRVSVLQHLSLILYQEIR